MNNPHKCWFYFAGWCKRNSSTRCICEAHDKKDTHIGFRILTANTINLKNMEGIRNEQTKCDYQGR